MAARLGLDPAEFLSKMKGVEGFTSGLNQRMSAEMKRTSREGAESFRLIDEALGIHVSRPLTKILTREFPAFAAGLQSIIGAGVVGALAAVGFAIAEHISKRMEEAKRKEEEYAAAVRKTATVIADARAESERRLNETLGKDASVRGDRAAEAYYKGLATDAENVERLAKFTDQLTESLRRQMTTLAALEPHMSAIGKLWHELWNTRGTLGIEKINDQVTAFQDKFAELSRQDALEHTTTAAVYLNDQLAAAQKKLEEMPKAMRDVTISVAPGAVANGGREPLYSPGEIAAQKLVLDRIKQIKDQQGRDAANAAADRKLERDIEAKKTGEEIDRKTDKIREKLKRIQEESVRLGKELHAALDKNDEIARLDEGLKNSLSTLAIYRAEAGSTRFFKEFGVSADRLAWQLATVTGQLESQVQLKKFLEETKEAHGDVVAPFPIAPGAAAMPDLVHGGGVAGAMAAFAEEPRKQIEMMKKAFDEALTPTEKLTIAQRELDLILKNRDGTFRAGAEGAAAYAGAMRHVTEEEERAEAASRKATDGLHALWLELTRGEASGKFTFELGTAMSRAFEDGIARTILATARQHREMRVMWQNYFRGLEEMALKFALSKSMASVLGELAKSTLGKSVGGWITGTGKQSGQAGNIAALDANTAAVRALTVRMSVGGAGGFSSLIPGSGGGGWSGGGAAGADGGAPVPFFAEGGDATPGSSFVSGEAGAERVDLTRSGGAHVTPLAAKSGDVTHVHYHMEGAVVTDDLLRKADAAHMMRQTSEQAVARSISMQSEIAKRSRPTR